MRKLIVRILGSALSFYVTSYVVGGFQIESSWRAYLLASVIFLLFNAIASPVIKLLLLPINLLTLGLFRWVVNVIVLYIFDLLYDGINITAYNFPGWSSSIISLPPFYVSLFFVILASSFLISLTSSLWSSLLSAE